jgi:hypothetical protein
MAFEVLTGRAAGEQDTPFRVADDRADDLLDRRHISP